MSRRRNKNKSKNRNKSSSGSRGGGVTSSLTALKNAMLADPVFQEIIGAGQGAGPLPDFLGAEGLAHLARLENFKPPQQTTLTLSPERQADELKDVAISCLNHHSTMIRIKAGGKQATITIDDFQPERFLEATVAASAANRRRVLLSYDHNDNTYEIMCSCGERPCVHSYQLMHEILLQLRTEDSPICKKIFGEGFADRKLAREQQEHARKQQQLLSMLQHAGRTTVAPSAGGLEIQDLTEPERVLWNLNVSFQYSRQNVELKVIRQKETKAGGWSKGREVSLKNFMEMPRDGWSKLDWAVAGKMQPVNWAPHFRLSDDDAFKILDGSDVFQLNREPATLEVRPYELIVLDLKDEKHGDGWRLTTSFRAIESEWDQSGDCVSIGCQEGHLVVDKQNARVAWVHTPPALNDLTRFLTMESIVFPRDQRNVLIAKLNELQGIVPIQLPASLGGEELPEVTESILLLRMKKTGAMEATVCCRDARELLQLPGDGLLRRQDAQTGKPVQHVRDAVVEREVARKIVHDLSLNNFRNIRDWSWQIDDPDAVLDLLSTAGELVMAERLKIVWHKSSAREFNIIGSVSAANVNVKVSRQRDWFGVNGTCKIGEHEVPLMDLLAGLRGTASMQGFIEISPGQWAGIADEFRATLQRLADVSNESRGKLQLDASAAMSLSAIEDKSLNIEADRAWKKCLDKVRTIKTVNPDPPASLNCDLREYQIEGFRWMCRLAEWGVGGILADDMGLGKTVQTLAVLLQRVDSGPALVIAPTSLGFNWEQECQRFAPSLTPRQMREADREELISNASDGDVIICSYGLALRETERLQAVNWGTLVLDEAQNIKNSNAKTSKEIRKLKADWKVALTGTPMENHLGELWSIFRAVSPGVLGAWEQFRKKFAGPIEKENDDERRLSLSRVISPFILRRSKSEVLTDLPERSESNLMIELTPEERERYDQVRLAAVGELDSLGDEDLSGDQRFKVLQLLTRLRQISCHVGMVDEKWNKGSSKLTMLMEQLEQLKERGHRPLIFSQFTSHLALIKEACDHQKISYQYLDGQTTPKARQQRVQAFQAGEGDAFLISLKAGGTGLNLTAADYVIHMDPWWNPAVEDQATDRAHRIGQQKNVMVYRIIAKGTIEEQILSMHAEKRDLVEGVLSGAEASGKMTTEQLADLIRNGVSQKV